VRQSIVTTPTRLLAVSLQFTMSRPRGSGYEALPAHDEIEEDEDAIDSGQMSASLPTGSLPARPSARGGRSHSRSALSLSLDTSALDAKLSQWHKSIKKKLAKKHSKRVLHLNDLSPWPFPVVQVQLTTGLYHRSHQAC
jgi:hypothetical protein